MGRGRVGVLTRADACGGFWTGREAGLRGYAEVLVAAFVCIHARGIARFWINRLSTSRS